MNCVSCTSSNQKEFPTEMLIHFVGLPNLDRPQVLIFPKALICMDCGFSQFMVPETELRLLNDGSGATSTAALPLIVGGPGR